MCSTMSHVLYLVSNSHVVIYTRKLDASHFLHYASTYSQMNKAFSQCWCITTWGRCEGSHFTLYTTYHAPNNKTIFFPKKGIDGLTTYLSNLSLSNLSLHKHLSLSLSLNHNMQPQLQLPLVIHKLSENVSFWVHRLPTKVHIINACFAASKFENQSKIAFCMFPTLMPTHISIEHNLP